MRLARLIERECRTGEFHPTKESVKELLASKSPNGWTVYGNLLDKKPKTVSIHKTEKTSEFARPAPSSLNPNFVTEQHENLNFIQDLSEDPLDDNMFKCPADSLYVAEISNCFVEDVNGLMYDIEVRTDLIVILLFFFLKKKENEIGENGNSQAEIKSVILCHFRETSTMTLTTFSRELRNCRCQTQMIW